MKQRASAVGSGPTQLACNLLQHATRDEPEPALYQTFKRQWIAPLDRERPWEISATAVRTWVQTWRARNPAADELPL